MADHREPVEIVAITVPVLLEVVCTVVLIAGAVVAAAIHAATVVPV